MRRDVLSQPSPRLAEAPPSGPPNDEQIDTLTQLDAPTHRWRRHPVDLLVASGPPAGTRSQVPGCRTRYTCKLAGLSTRHARCVRNNFATAEVAEHWDQASCSAPPTFAPDDRVWLRPGGWGPSTRSRLDDNARRRLGPSAWWRDHWEETPQRRLLGCHGTRSVLGSGLSKRRGTVRR